MSAPPYMPFYVGDYLADTTHLTTTEHGAYLLLLATMWRAGGSLPADDAKLARFARLTPAQWARIKGTILTFFSMEDGQITQGRLSREMERHSKAVKQRRDSGSLGGIAKALKNNVVPLAGATFSPKQPEPEPEPERIVGVVAREREEDWPQGDPAKALVAVVSSPWLDPMKTPGLVLSAGRVSAWRREGASWTEDVVPVVTANCLKRRSPVGSWQFFDAAIAQSIANNRAKLTIPEAREAGSSANIMDRMAADRAEAKRLAWARLDAEEAKASNGKP